MELINRPRRLRQNEAIRRMCRETRLSVDSLIYPIFVDETLTGKRPIPALDGQYHYGVDAVNEAVEECLGSRYPGGDPLRAPGREGCAGLFRLGQEGCDPGGDSCHQGQTSGVLSHHRRVYVRVYRPRPLRYSMRE